MKEESFKLRVLCFSVMIYNRKFVKANKVSFYKYRTKYRTKKGMFI